MKKLVVLLIVVLVCMVQIVSAQDNGDNFDAGSKALLFQFSGFSDLGANSYMGGIGGKYFLSPSMAVRGALQFASLKDEEPFNPTPGTNETGKDGKLSASIVGLAGGVEIHSNANRVSPYFGAGAAFRTASSEEKNVVTDPTPQTTVKNEFGYTELAVFAMIGAEFFLYKKMLSLAAEYQLGYAKRSYKDAEITTGNVTVTNKQGSASVLGITSSGMLTLAVYL